jgi:hypothetical protein
MLKMAATPRALGLSMLILLAADARAGDFCGSLDGAAAVRELERYADGKDGRVLPECFTQSYGDELPAAVDARVLAACTRALGLAAQRRNEGLDSWCALRVLSRGTARAGDRDLVGELIARAWRWDGWAPYQALAATSDARVRPFVLQQYAAHRDAWRKKRLRAAWARDSWRSHELAVLAALEKIGTADDLTVIAEIEAAEPRDRGIARAVAAARRQAEQRH